MPTELATVNNITVVQEDDGRVHWISGAAIDADGSNGQNNNAFAYRADDTGLDAILNAGWPDQGWRDVLLDRGDGTPLSDGHGNWYSQTAYAWHGRSVSNRYVDATKVPYVVVNPIVRRHAIGIIIGCRAQVTFNGHTIDAVVADVSGAKDIGELSIRAAELLDIKHSPRTGGVTHGVKFEIWPGISAVINGETYDLRRG